MKIEDFFNEVDGGLFNEDYALAHIIIYVSIY